MQPDDLQAVADVIAQAIHEALAPVLERLDAVDERLDEIELGEKALGLLRERVAVVETKADRPPAPVDVTPVLERLAHELRGEFAAVVGGVLQDVTALRERAAVLETRAPAAIDLTPVLDRVTELDGRIAIVAGETALALTKEFAPLRERLAVLETRAPVPGRDGLNGQDGTNGTNGMDGLGFDDLTVEFDGDRTLAFRMERTGLLAKVFPITLPFLRYQGVYEQGKSYDVGDTVTWGGAMWHCQEATITKPGESTAWKLCVNRGRDGKAGKDGAPAPLPVVTVGKA